MSSIPPSHPNVAFAPSSLSSPATSPTLSSSPPSHSSHSSSSSSSSSSSEDDSSAPPPLPTFSKPKGITERHALKVKTGSSGSGRSMGANLVRRRADSLKWSKYDAGGVFELNLKPDELRRVA